MFNKTRFVQSLIALSLALPLAWLSAESYASDFPESARQQALNMAADFPRLHSIMAAHDGDVIIAEAFRGPGLDTPANIKSLSKTVLSAVVGGAVDRGEVRLDQAITDLMPNRIPDNATPGIERITLANLVSMQAGLERTSGRNYGRWVVSNDWVAYALSRPFVDEPGGRMLYSTGSTHLASVALTETTGRSTLALAREYLGEPLGIRIDPWLRDPQGAYFGGNDMVMSPRDLLTFGEMYRQGGRHNGVQVLSEDWVATSWEPNDRSPWTDDAYGYGWFITELAGETVYYGRGFGGQVLYVVPSVALTVVITSDPNPPSPGGRYLRELHQIVAQVLIPAAHHL